jgi:hypothetical protein
MYVDWQWVQVNAPAAEAIGREVGLRKKIDMIDQHRWKYLVSLDGNGWAARLPYLMGLESLVFKETSDYSTWWYPLLVPYENYVPFDVTPEDIAAKIAWARREDERAQDIAIRGAELARMLYGKSTVQLDYACRVLKKYASLRQKDRKSDWVSC